MITSRLDTLDIEAATLPTAVVEGLRFLAASDLAALPVGRIDIDGDRLFALIQDYDTAPKPTRRPEAHARYIDIQYLVSGEEVIGWAPIGTAPAPEEDLIASRDVRFYPGPQGETDVVLGAGAYAVFFPWDIHRPGCMVTTPTAVRKVVVKILA